MDSTKNSSSTRKDKKIMCRLCARENDKCFEIFSEQGLTWKIASIVSSHFWFKVNKGKWIPEQKTNRNNLWQLSKSDEYLHICHTCWWKIENFHVYYLEVQEAQKFFESTDLECTKQNTNENLGSSSTDVRNTNITNETSSICDNPQNELGEHFILLIVNLNN